MIGIVAGWWPQLVPTAVVLVLVGVSLGYGIGLVDGWRRR